MPTPDVALLLTAPGVAALAVVRVAGRGVGAFLRDRFSRPTSPGRPVHGVLSDDDGAIDDPVVTLAPDGDSADVCLHGGEWIVTRTLRLLAASGFETPRPDPGDPLPAFAVDPIDADDEIERSVLQHLPLATTDLGAETLLRQIDLWNRHGPVEHWPADLAASVAADASLWHLLHPPTVAIVGRPNVGKSTLANRLTGRPTSIVADRPGTTRDWVGDTADLDGLPVVLIDTPGRRATADPIERAAIAASRPVADSADFAVWVVDASRVPTDAEWRDLAGRPAGRSVLFFNKSDLPVRWARGGIAQLEGSAATERGVDDLIASLRTHFGVDRVGDDRPRWWTVKQRARLAERAG